jgi:hypothetical protein
VTKICLTYLMFCAFGGSCCSNEAELRSRLQIFPFLTYAAHHWGHHAGATEDQDVQELVLKFLMSESNLLCAGQVEEMPDSPHDFVSVGPLYFIGLHAAASLGLRAIVNAILA